MKTVTYPFGEIPTRRVNRDSDTAYNNMCQWSHMHIGWRGMIREEQDLMLYSLIPEACHESASFRLKPPSSNRAQLNGFESR